MYSNQAKDAYLETQVATATPQKLRLMLIEGAIRRIDLAGLAFEESREADGYDALLRVREIVSELLAGIRPDDNPLTQHSLALYGFLFQHISIAIQEGSMPHAREVQGVLLEERITWQQLCELHAEKIAPVAGNLVASEEILAPQTLAGTAWGGAAAAGPWSSLPSGGGVSTGLSFDA